MKKIFTLIFVAFAIVFCAGCKMGTRSITYFQDKINETRKVYEDASSVSALLEMEDENGKSTFELQYNYNADKTAIESMMYKLTTKDSTQSIYIKDGKAYMDRFGDQWYTELSAADMNDIVTQYGFKAFTSDVFSFLGASFFESAKVIADNKEETAIELDLSTYALSAADEGTVELVEMITKISAKKEVTLDLSFNKDTIKSLKVNMLSRDDVSTSFTLTLQGTKQNTIAYPDFSTYEAK